MQTTHVQGKILSHKRHFDHKCLFGGLLGGKCIFRSMQFLWVDIERIHLKDFLYNSIHSLQVSLQQLSDAISIRTSRLCTFLFRSYRIHFVDEQGLDDSVGSHSSVP